MIGSLGIAFAATIIFLVTAVHDRANAGAAVTPTPTLPPAIARAEAAVSRHPGSASAYLDLGTVLMNAGDNADADSAFRQAMTLAPARPEPATMHAMVIGSSGKAAQAEAVLHAVERDHPAYARAWLLDGILSSRSAATRAHAIVAWKRFLRLQPSGQIARTVRGLLAQAESRA
jgi:cytochrome c-type biogenesis protein CcmH/NrfG